MDKRTNKLLERINALCSGAFRIVEEEELLAAFSREDGVDGEGVRRMLAFLEAGGYVAVEYDEAGVYCVRPLPAGRLYFERTRQEQAKKRRTVRFFALIAGGCAFLGAFLGGALALLLV